MDDNTRSINKINEQIKMLNSNPKDDETSTIDYDNSFDNDDTLIVDKIENLEEIKNDNISEEKNIDKAQDIIEDDKKNMESIGEKENFLILYLIIVILLIILGILIYFL